MTRRQFRDKDKVMLAHPVGPDESIWTGSICQGQRLDSNTSSMIMTAAYRIIVALSPTGRTTIEKVQA